MAGTWLIVTTSAVRSIAVHGAPLSPPSAPQVRSLATLALAQALLAQPPQAAGGTTPAVLRSVHAEPLSTSAVRVHGAIRRAGALLRVRCLVQRELGG